MLLQFLLSRADNPSNSQAVLEGKIQSSANIVHSQAFTHCQGTQPAVCSAGVQSRTGGALVFLCFRTREKEVREETHQLQSDINVNARTSYQLVVKEALGGQ